MNAIVRKPGDVDDVDQGRQRFAPRSARFARRHYNKGTQKNNLDLIYGQNVKLFIYVP
jgi:hypothetical protein